MWKRTEDKYLAPLLGGRAVSYALYEGKFVRSIALPDKDCTAEELAGVISAYVQLMDKSMKGFLTQRMDAGDIEKAYCERLQKQQLHI